MCIRDSSLPDRVRPGGPTMAAGKDYRLLDTVLDAYSKSLHDVKGSWRPSHSECPKFSGPPELYCVVADGS
eukprot:4038326-Lingulodinium_polyedra.AAC.1